LDGAATSIMSHQSWSSRKQRQTPLLLSSSVAGSLAASLAFVLLAAVASASPIAAPGAVELLHEPAVPSSPAGAGAEAAERAALAMRQVEAICGGDPECEDVVAEEQEEEEEMELEPRPRRGGSGYYFRTRKDGMEDKRSRGYLFRTRKSVGLGGQQVRNRKGGYLFRTRRDPGMDSGMGKRAEYLFRTRRTPYVAAGKRQGSYLFRTRKSYPMGFGYSSYENAPRSRRGQSYLFRT